MHITYLGMYRQYIFSPNFYRLIDQTQIFFNSSDFTLRNSPTTHITK